MRVAALVLVGVIATTAACGELSPLSSVPVVPKPAAPPPARIGRSSAERAMYIRVIGDDLSRISAGYAAARSACAGSLDTACVDSLLAAGSSSAALVGDLASHRVSPDLMPVDARIRSVTTAFGSAVDQAISSVLDQQRPDVDAALAGVAIATSACDSARRDLRATA